MFSLVLCLLMTYSQVIAAQYAEGPATGTVSIGSTTNNSEATVGGIASSPSQPASQPTEGSSLPLEEGLPKTEIAIPPASQQTQQQPGLSPSSSAHTDQLPTPIYSEPSNASAETTQGTQQPQTTPTKNITKIPPEELARQNTTVVENNATSTAAAPNVGVDDGDGGVADDLADYVYKAVGKLINGDPKTALKDCSKEPTLNLSCPDIPPEVMAYFNKDVSVKSILSRIFDESVVNELRSTCRPGQWCLPMSTRKDIETKAIDFLNNGPVCSDAMRECLSVLIANRDCNEEDLEFLYNAVGLLCVVGRYDEEQKQYIQRDPCFSAVKEALYVLYSVLTSPTLNKISDLQLSSEDCTGFAGDITRTYLCTCAYCDAVPEDRLREFYFWRSIALNATEMASVCHINVTQCPYYGIENNDTQAKMKDAVEVETEMEQLEKEIENAFDEAFAGEADYTTKDYYGDPVTVTEGNVPNMPVQDDSQVIADQGDTAGQDGNGEGTATSFNQADNTMIFGLVTMTSIILLVFIGVAFMGIKRYRYSRMSNYRRGYSQLTEEERMLRNEYN